MRDVNVEIQEHILPSDFVVLPMREFDAIFGMDWMNCHRVLIDCKRKKVQLMLKRRVRVAFLAEVGTEMCNDLAQVQTDGLMSSI